MGWSVSIRITEQEFIECQGYIFSVGEVNMLFKYTLCHQENSNVLGYTGRVKHVHKSKQRNSKE